MAPQKTDRLFERRVWTHGEYIVAHHLFDGHGIGKPVDRFAAVDHHARGIGVAQITIGHYSDQHVIIENRQLVNAVFGHQLASDADAIEGFDGENGFGHPISNTNLLHLVLSGLHHICSTV